MFNWMQKHRRFMMFFIFVFVGLPLALFIPGGGSGGNNGDLAGGDTPVAEVGDEVITATDFLQEFSRYQGVLRQQNLSTEPLELLANGSVDDIVDVLIRRALIAQEAGENAVLPNQEYLAKRLQEDAFFKNEEGEFVPAFYNQWVEGQSRGGMNWDSFYESYALGVSQSMFAKLIVASPRVSESEMHDAFLRTRRKMKVKYVAIEPEVSLTEEELRAHFDETPENYMTDEERQVQYVAFSVQAPVPEEVAVAIERARAGEEFTDLVEQYSVGGDTSNGGDLGWISVTEEPTAQQEAIFALKEGEVSEPVRSGNEVYVYKVVEERINEEDDSMEVHARRIVFRPMLGADARAAIEEQSSSFLTAVTEADGDISGTAAAAGLSVVTSGLFSTFTNEIDTVDANDVFGFRQGFGSVEINTVGAEVVRGNSNLYVGKVMNVSLPQQQTFEEAREDVERDAVNLYKNGPEYVEQVGGYISTISAEAKSLADIAALIPDLSVEIKETREFGMNDFLFSDGIFWNTQEAFGLMDTAKPGELKGPMVDFQRVSHFLELVEMVDPDPEVVGPEWEETKESILESRLLNIQNARQADYLKFKSEKAQAAGQVMRYNDIIPVLLGINIEADAPSSEEATAPELVESTPEDGLTVEETDVVVEEVVPEESAN